MVECEQQFAKIVILNEKRESGMKSINVQFSNDQCEALEEISKLCQKNTPDFIREALICLLPLNEYVNAKNNLIELTDNTESHHDSQIIIEASNNIQNVNNSTVNRLKRLGLI